jgi:hypothetical protein
MPEIILALIAAMLFFCCLTLGHILKTLLAIRVDLIERYRSRGEKDA